MSLASDIYAQALTLSDKERAELAQRLLLSLEPDGFDRDSDALWAAEIEARSAAVASGNYQASDWRDAVDRIRQSLPPERP